MTIVVDASVVTSWYFRVENSPRADRLLQSREWLIAPDILIPEFTNAAWKAVLFGGFSADVAAEAIADVAYEIEEIIPSLQLKDRALAIGLELRHPVYDCFYLALAELRDCQLVTADDRLVRRCGGTPFADLVTPL